MSTPLNKVVSGGQTGVDRAALDAAMALAITVGGWCPKGRRAEDGPIAAYYPLQETPQSDYFQRTEWNVRDSDGTLILAWGKPTGGTGYTVGHAKQLGKPCLCIDLGDKIGTPLASVALTPTIAQIQAWLQTHKIVCLNVAGPRENSTKQIYPAVYELLLQLFKQSCATAAAP